MKKLTIILLLLISTLLFGNELAWVDEQVEAIKPPRKGISAKEISKLKTPFIFLKSPKKGKKGSSSSKRVARNYSKSTSKSKSRTFRFVLEAVMNKSALINGKWYKEGQKVYRYTLKKVNLKTVLLVRGKKKILLSTMSKNKNLKINNK